MNKLRSFRSQRGLTLLENLVALLLLSFALLGLAGLIAKTLSREKDSVSHSLAALQAQDIADRMRANRIAYDDGNYFTYLDTTAASPETRGCSEGGFGASSSAANCTPAQIAEDDAYSWRQWVKQSLPGGVAIVCKDDSPDDGTDEEPACQEGSTRVVIKIFWNVSRTGGRASSASSPSNPDNIQRFVMVYQP